MLKCFVAVAVVVVVVVAGYRSGLESVVVVGNRFVEA